MNKSNKMTIVSVTLLAAIAAGTATAGQKPKHSSAPQVPSSVQRAPAGAQDAPADASEQSRIKRGFEIAPVYLDLHGRNRALVGLGSYIVNAQGGCNDCHTWPNFAPNGNPYFGQPKMINATNYLAGGRPFGPFRSRNLTPDPNSTMTTEQKWQEFLSIMRTGVDPDAEHPQFGPLLQVMPWPLYHDMTDHDLRAIFEYLQAIPHAEPYCTPSNPDPICKP